MSARPGPFEVGLPFRTADLVQPRRALTLAEEARVAIPQGVTAKIVDEGNALGHTVETLLAALLRVVQPRNAAYAPTGFSLSTWSKQQVFTENPQRASLLIQNVGSGDLMVVFQSGPVSPQSFSSASGQIELTTLQLQAIRIVAGGSYEPYVTPTNAITLFTLGTATAGVAIEGN